MKFDRIALIAASILPSCVMSASYPPRYLNIPFTAGIAGAAIDAEFRVSSEAYYGFYLNLMFREGDEADRSRIQKLAGSFQGLHGQRVDNGLPIPVTLKISRGSNGQIEGVLMGTFMEQELESFSANDFEKAITGLTLEPGVYHVNVEALRDIPELGDVEVRFDVHPPSRK